jgi:hypothetical protein
MWAFLCRGIKMARTTKDGFELVPKKGRKLQVLPDLFEWYMDELGWERADLWDHILKLSRDGGPDKSTLDKVFQTGWASRKTYRLVLKAIRKELAGRYLTEDVAERMDPARVPMPNRLDRWPKRGE